MNMKTIAVLLVGIVAALNSVFGAPRVSDISARQRYPWNGLVDLKFTGTGTSGTKYDTSFIAKDMVGGTNITMVTVRNKEGASIDVTKEQLIPGTYNWVWDAAKDLPKDFVCERVVVTGTAVEVDPHDKVQLWEGGPYWATTNIGAEKPWGRGYYFWWGDVVGYKSGYGGWVASDPKQPGFAFYPSNVPTEGKKYTDLQKEGWITEDGVLAPEHDAAHMHWGANWRMPTYQELKNLSNKCNWIWTTTNNVNGYIVRGKGAYVSNSIFLPCTGGIDGQSNSLVYDGESGYCWSSEPYSSEQYPYNAWQIYFYLGNHNVNNVGRPAGIHIRPVKSSSE